LGDHDQTESVITIDRNSQLIPSLDDVDSSVISHRA